MAYEAINKICVFVDTNKLEVYFGGNKDKKRMALGTMRFSPDFYSLLEFCNNFDNVEVFIPAIVWKEVCAHLSKYFKKSYDEMKTTIEQYKKIFGDLFEFNIKTNGYNDKTYAEHVSKLSDEFWEQNKDKCQMADVNLSSEHIKTFIDKAVSSIKPFTRATGNKEYSDAGFKDAIIIETMLSACQEDEIAILFSDDNDFNDVFKLYDANKFKAFRTLEDVKSEINEILKLNDDKVVKAIFEDSSYVQETLLTTLGIVYDKSITKFIVKSVEKSDDEDSLFNLEIDVCANEVEYKIYVTYDVAANESLDIRYEQHND